MARAAMMRNLRRSLRLRRSIRCSPCRSRSASWGARRRDVNAAQAHAHSLRSRRRTGRDRCGLVIAAKAGIHGRDKTWVPAFAGMTVEATEGLTLRGDGAPEVGPRAGVQARM